MHQRLLLALLVGLLVACGGGDPEPSDPPDTKKVPQPAPTPDPPPPPKEPDAIVEQRYLYPLKVSAVSDAPLPARPIEVIVGERLIMVASEAEAAAVRTDATAALAKIDDAFKATQRARFPTTCGVCWAKLGDGAVELLHGHRLIRVCSAGCQKRFEGDIPKYLKRVDELITEQQVDDFPLPQCVVSQKKLGHMQAGTPTMDIIFHDTLVRVCCDTCVHRWHNEFRAKDRIHWVRQIRKARGWPER